MTVPDIATWYGDMLGGYLGYMLHKFDDLAPSSSAAGPPGVRLRIGWTHSTIESLTCYVGFAELSRCHSTEVADSLSDWQAL